MISGSRRELARQLAPVAAPDSLWDRINRVPSQPQRGPRRGIPLEWAFWPVAAAMALLAFAGISRALQDIAPRDTLPEEELALIARTPTELDFRSDSFEETRAWVKAEANIDIALPPEQPTGYVRLLGARIIQLRGLRIAAIDYRAGDRLATLFVSGVSAPV